MSEEYLFPSETAVLLVLLFVPPLLLAAGGQSWFLIRRCIGKGRAFVALLVAVLTTSVLGTSVWVLGEKLLPKGLGLQDLWFGRHWIPVLPLAFIIAAVVAATISWLCVNVGNRPDKRLQPRRPAQPNGPRKPVGRGSRG